MVEDRDDVREDIIRGTRSKDSLSYGPDISQGLFFDKNKARLMSQAAKNLGGIKIEELGDTLPSGKSTSPQDTGLRVTRMDGETNLGPFWNEVRRLEDESKKK